MGILRALAATLFALGAAAQQQPAPKGAVEGQVVSAATGEPLRKARLMLRRTTNTSRGSMPYSGATDNGGRFVFPQVEPGTYRLSADRNGYVRGEYGARDPNHAGTDITVGAGQNVKDVMVRLVPQAVVTGRVLDEDGEPAANASVSVLRYTYSRGQRQLVPVDSANTDDRGEYRIYALAPGKYYVRASFRGPGGGPPFSGPPGAPVPTTPESEETYVPVYYPNALDPSGAALVDAPAGGVVRGIDMALARSRTVHLSGRVLENGTRPAGRGTRVSLVPRGNTAMSGRAPMAFLDSAGRFVIRGVSPGPYTLAADRYEDEQRYSARVPVDVGSASIDNLALQLAPAIELQGIVRVEGAADTKLSGIRVGLQSRTADMRYSGRDSGGRVNDSGAFALGNIAPDTYTLTLSGMPAGAYLKSVRLGTEDALAAVNVTRGAAPLEIVISSAAGQVDGTVQDAKQQPAAGATVVAVPDSARRGLPFFYKSASTDQTGRFSLTGLAPGEYKLFAWQEVESGAWQDPEFLRPVENKGESVSVKESGKESVQLKLLE